MSSLFQSKWATPPPQPLPSAPPQTSSREQTSTTTLQPQAPPDSSSTLSAVVPEFSPSTAPTQDVSTRDTFAESGPTEDELFADGFTPLEESMQTRPQDDLFDDDFVPATQPITETASYPSVQPIPDQPQAEHVSGRGRGRGNLGQANSSRSNASRDIANQKQIQAPDNAPKGPKKETTAAVRGDRQATGGLRKSKLTESELAEKMARIQIKNASLTAAHARAEADAASFAQREEKAKVEAKQRAEAANVRTREERRDRQQMIGEREKNRMRKLKAMEGREWDAEKNEDDFARGGRYDKKGSFAGDKADYTDGREYLLKEPRGIQGARGGRQSERGGRPHQQQTQPKSEDFPALPVTSKEDNKEGSNSKRVDLTDTAANLAGKSWADQVELSAS